MSNDWVSENRALERKEAMKDSLEDQLDKMAPWIQHFVLIFTISVIIEAALAILVLVPVGVFLLVTKMGESLGG